MRRAGIGSEGTFIARSVAQHAPGLELRHDAGGSCRGETPTGSRAALTLDYQVVGSISHAAHNDLTPTRASAVVGFLRCRFRNGGPGPRGEGRVACDQTTPEGSTTDYGMCCTLLLGATPPTTS